MSEGESNADPVDPQRESQAGDLPTQPPVSPSEPASSGEADPASALPPPLIGRESSSVLRTSLPPPPRPAEEEKKKAAPSWVTLGVVALALGILLLVTAPLLASVSLLTETTRRSLQAVGGERAGVVHASLGWKEGLTLERVYLPDPQPGMPSVVLHGLKLETNLVQAASGYLWGDTVLAKLVAREGRISFGTAAVSSDASAAPSSASQPAAATEPFRLPFPLRPSIDLAGIDLEINWQPGAVEPRRALFRGLEATGGGLIGTDLALQLDDGLQFKAEALTVERVEDAGPALVFGLEEAEFSTQRLVVPAPDSFTAQAVNTQMSIKAPRARFQDLDLTELSAELSFREGLCELSCAGREGRGGLTVSSRYDMRDPRRWPSTLKLALKEVNLTPDLRASLPVLVPLLAATSASGNPGLPPLSLDLDAQFEVVFTEEGAFDLDATLATVQGAGTFSLSPGRLNASLLVDGYVRALLNVSVAPLSEQLFPPVLEIQEVRGSFSVKDGVVSLPRVELRAPRIGLLLAGTARFDGSFELLVTTLLPAGELSLAQRLAKAVDQAGGVTLTGSLVDGTVDYRLPEAGALLVAVREQGAVESLASATGDLGGELRRLLEGAK